MKIACLTASSLGGAQKAAWLYAHGLAAQGHEVTVVSSPGPLTPNFSSGPISVLYCNSDSEWEDFLLSGWADVVHHHVPGYYQPQLIYRLLDRLPRRPFRLIETNVFGWLTNPEADRHTDFRMFISMANGAQAFRRSGISDISPYLKNHTALYYPVPPAPALDPQRREEIRAGLGVGKEEVLAVRFGRPDPRKWGDWECRAFALAKRTAPNLRFLMVEPPEGLRRRINAGEFGSGMICRDMIASQVDISEINQAADLGLHASRFGESFGYTIAEAMAAGLPVISRTTPWGDNAQVELIQHGESGLICNSVEGLGQALADLATCSENRLKMGQKARSRILQLASPDTEAAILSEICLGNTGQGSLLQERNADFARFFSEFPELEKVCVERVRGHVNFKSKCMANLEATWWLAKARIRFYRAAWRTRMGLPAYK